MKRLRPKIRYSALLLPVLTLHILLHSFVLPKFVSTTFQERGACEVSSMDDDGDNQARVGDCKPPKHSFIDYSTFFLPKSFLPAYAPSVFAFMPHEPFRVHRLVYLEINVPPDNLV